MASQYQLYLPSAAQLKHELEKEIVELEELRERMAEY